MAKTVISRSEGRSKRNLPEDKVQRHLLLIQDAYQEYNRSFAGFVKALAAAKKELGADTLDKEIAAKLNISKATMSRHMAVAECDPLIQRLPKLPKAMCALYPLARMRDMCAKLADNDQNKGDKDYEARLDKYSPQTKTAEIEKDFKNLDLRLSKKLDQERQSAKTKRRDLILETSDKELGSNGTRVIRWNDLLVGKEVFFTILMVPDEKDQRYLNQEKLLESDVVERLDIARFRSPSQADNVMGLVLCQAKYLLGGIKLLHASGFRYQSAFVEPVNGAKIQHLRDQNVLLFGSRGDLKELAEIPETETMDVSAAIRVAEALGKSPRLLIWHDSEQGGWTCTVPPPV
jgi:hypothetical protein